MARAWAETWHGPVPKLIFEEGDIGRGKLEKALKDNNFPAAQFRPKKDRIDKHGEFVKGAIPLQAADLMAYEAFDPMKKVQRDGRLSKLKRTFEELDKIPGEIGVIRTQYTQLVVLLSEAPAPQVIIPPPGYEQR